MTDILSQKPQLCNAADSHSFGQGHGLECSFQHEMPVWGLFDVTLTLPRLSISRVPLGQVRSAASRKGGQSPNQPTCLQNPLWDGVNHPWRCHPPFQGLQGKLQDSPGAAIPPLWLTGVNPIPLPIHCPELGNRSCQAELKYQDPEACAKSQFPTL